MSNQAAPTTSNVVGIHQKAMLVQAIYRYKGWTAQDPEFKQIIAAQTGANPERVTGSKRLINSEFPELARLRKIKNEAYKHHLENTLPWDNWSRRLLTSANYVAYTQAQRQFKAEYEAARDDLAAKIDDIKADAQANLGTAYREEDFRDLNRIDELYVIEHDFEPLPDNDFRVTVTDAEKRKLQEDAERRLQKRVDTAISDLWSRLEGSLSLMAERLAQYDDPEREKRKQFDQSWLNNVRAVVDAIPSLNFTGSNDLDKLAQMAKATVCRFENEELKTDPAARAEAVASAEQVMDKMQGLFGGPKAA